MRALYYRLTVLGCSISWFLVGLHLPTLHEVVDHGRSVHWSVVGIVALLGALAVAALLVLLRAPAAQSHSPHSAAAP